MIGFPWLQGYGKKMHTLGMVALIESDTHMTIATQALMIHRGLLRFAKYAVLLS